MHSLEVVTPIAQRNRGRASQQLRLLWTVPDHWLLPILPPDVDQNPDGRYCATCGRQELTRRCAQGAWPRGPSASDFCNSQGWLPVLSKHTLVSQGISKFEKSFKDPKFVELFAEYAKEIASPEVNIALVKLFHKASVLEASHLLSDFCTQARAEQEQYLKQLEDEGRAQEVYGKGMQLVLPSPSFVAKTANSQSGQKVFINVCTSDKVCEPAHCLHVSHPAQMLIHVTCMHRLLNYASSVALEIACAIVPSRQCAWLPVSLSIRMHCNLVILEVLHLSHGVSLPAVAAVPALSNAMHAFACLLQAHEHTYMYCPVSH